MATARVCETGATLCEDQHMNRPIAHLGPGRHVTTRGPWIQGVHVSVELTCPAGFVYGDLIDLMHAASHEHKE